MQVYVDRKLVGHYHGAVQGNQVAIRMLSQVPQVVYSSYEQYEPEPLVYDTITLKVERLNFRLTNFDISMMGAGELEYLLQKRDVPEDAERLVDPGADTVTWRWRALTCSEEVHEQIFDLDAFEPV